MYDSQFKLFSNNRNMSLSKKPSKANLRITTEDLSACLDQKNNIILVLQGQVEDLRVNQQNYDRAKEQLYRVKCRFENLIRQYECSRENNQERLEFTAKSVFQLKVQIDHLDNELKLKGLSLKEAKFHLQQLMEQANRKEDEVTDIQIKLQEYKSLAQIRKMEQERLKLQVLQLKEEVDKQKKECDAIKKQSESVTERCHKTQSYIRNLLREQSNLNENLTKIQDENNQLDKGINGLEALIASNNNQIAHIQKDCQESKFMFASKELQKKRIQNETKEKAKIFNLQKEKSRNLFEQIQQKRYDGARIESQLKDSCEQINFIISKNGDIADVNEQLKQDLRVCQRHLQNLVKTNKSIEAELQLIQEVSLSAIKKIQEPMAPKNLNTMYSAKWNSSRVTGCQTNDFQACRNKKL